MFITEKSGLMINSKTTVKVVKRSQIRINPYFGHS